MEILSVGKYFIRRYFDAVMIDAWEIVRVISYEPRKELNVVYYHDTFVIPLLKTIVCNRLVSVASRIVSKRARRISRAILLGNEYFIFSSGNRAVFASCGRQKVQCRRQFR